MQQYYTARVCRKGHEITVRLECTPDAEDSCSKCGSPGIDGCEYCGAPIKGDHKKDNVIILFQPPVYCYSCGNRYPWAQPE